MTIKIEVLANPDRGPMRAQIDDAMQALGFMREGVIYDAAKLTSETASAMGEMLARGEAQEAIDNAPGPNPEPPKPEPAKRGRKAKEAAPQISTSPENRVPPPEPEVAEQDAEDEQAEVEANTKPNAPLTADDVRNAMTEYVTKFGIDATQADGLAITGDALGKPPAGAEAWSISVIVGAGQDTIAKAVAAWQSAAGGAERYKAK